MLELLRLLLAFGAGPAQRGINDYSALHMAVSVRYLPAVEMLLAAGADAASRTRIDDRETPREMAEAMGLSGISQLLAAHEVSERL
ncbi:hypothetical protein [Cupriavidus sp. 8B]